MQIHVKRATRTAALPDATHPRADGMALGLEEYLSVLSLLEYYEPISLAQMDAVSLMNRVDTKYVMSVAELHTVLASVIREYRVLEVEGMRMCHYETLYFDTQSLALYASHLVGRSERFKVRSRKYLDSGVSFFEVKHRTNKGRTIKDRIKTEAFLTHLTPEADQFLDSLLTGTHPLQPVLWNDFSRITLVSRSRQERVTLDLDVRFRVGESTSALGQVVVVEVKQDALDRTSEVMEQMRALGVRSRGFSKFCVGMARLYPQVKHNRLMPVLRLVDNIMQGGQNG